LTVASASNFGRLEDRVDAFLLRGIDKGAGVDDENVRLVGFIGNLDAVFQQRANHNLGIDEVLGATERNQSHAQGSLCGGLHLLEAL
jgi:hypothetical protein